MARRDRWFRVELDGVVRAWILGSTEARIEARRLREANPRSTIRVIEDRGATS